MNLWNPFRERKKNTPRVWAIDPNDPYIIRESGDDPHTVCGCYRKEDARLILRLLPLLSSQEEHYRIAVGRAEILQSQRNALLNAIEIAGFRLNLANRGLTLEIVPSDGVPDGGNSVILQKLPLLIKRPHWWEREK